MYFVFLENSYTKSTRADREMKQILKSNGIKDFFCNLYQVKRSYTEIAAQIGKLFWDTR